MKSKLIFTMHIPGLIVNYLLVHIIPNKTFLFIILLLLRLLSFYNNIMNPFYIYSFSPPLQTTAHFSWPN